MPLDESAFAAAASLAATGRPPWEHRLSHHARAVRHRPAVIAAPAAAAGGPASQPATLTITAVKAFAVSIPSPTPNGPTWNQCLVKVETAASESHVNITA